MRISKRILRLCVIAAVYLAVWQAAAWAAGSALLLPGPGAAIGRFFSLLSRGESWARAGMTLLRVLSGYLAGVAAGVLLAALTARFRFADALLSPLRSIVKATPVTSFILLALLWLRSGVVP
ncbi:MAG: nitrate ABC transporter permease, partial [Clostridia bacterium]|nr:nitrate ABC transporter permease [Clostridia bacterium]